jgi:HAMP domain-containing protein
LRLIAAAVDKKKHNTGNKKNMEAIETLDTAKAGEKKNARKRSRITRKFNWLLFTLYIIIIGVSVPATYFVTKQQIFDQANRELALLVDMVRSVRNVVREDTRPYFLPRGEFFAPVVSSTVMAKTVASKFAKLRPEYYIRIVSDNPLNRDNLPTPAELAILKRFRQANAPDSIVETGILRKENYLISAAPAKARAGCLTCHGSIDDAPNQITDQYGTISGYDYREGTVVGASVVGVPMADLLDVVLVRSLAILAVTTLVFSLIFLFINGLIKRSIIRPILQISESAKSVSRGNIGEEISMDRNDEIGDLAHSIELMRRSLVLMVRKVSGKGE